MKKKLPNNEAETVHPNDNATNFNFHSPIWNLRIPSMLFSSSIIPETPINVNNTNKHYIDANCKRDENKNK